MTADLVQFLRDRLDDDEQTARETLWEGSGNRPIWDLRASATVEVGGNGRNDFPVGDAAVAWHIVVHDPARVLAEVDAKRALLDDLDYGGSEMADARWHVARRLASVYADHPDYCEEWKP